MLGVLPLAGAALGLAAIPRRLAGLFGMVALSIALYAGFVLVYWHFEGRYFQVAVPWLLMLLAWGLVWAWDRLQERLDAGGARWGLLFLPLVILFAVWQPLAAIGEQVERDAQPTGFVKTMRWLRDNSTAGDVVLTRDPWELNWYTRGRAVMIPFNDLATVKRIAREYGVTMLQLGGPVDRVDTAQCPEEGQTATRYPTGSRPALGSLYCGREIPGFKLVYQDGGGTIYRLVDE